jgi:hypothetical protein
MRDLTQDPSQLHVEENVQTFLDNVIIYYAGFVARRWHRPEKHAEGPVLQKDRPWEHVPYFTYSNYTVLRDPEDRLFKCWYEDLLAGPDYHDEDRYFKSRQLYAQSEDGIHWEKPELDALTEDGRKTNIVIGGGDYGTAHSMSVVIDPHPATPGERFRALCTHMSRKGKEFDRIECFHSPDGMQWDLYDELPSFGMAGARLDDVSVLFYDDDSREFVQNTRHFLKGGGSLSTPGGGLHHFAATNYRRIWQSRSHDFIHWSEPILVAAADPELDNLDEQFYGMAQYKLGNIHLATVGVFRQADNEMDVQLLVSRDGIRWKRTAKLQPFLAPRGEGYWDAHMVSIVSPPIEVGDELWFYHGGTTTHHDWWLRDDLDIPEAKDQSLIRYCLGLARLRRDGYVGIYGTKPRPGCLITQSMMSRGTKLVINARCSPGGFIRVEVRDNYGNLIEPFSEENCDPFTSDSVEHTVTWKGKPTIPVRDWRRLAFTIAGAELFSFHFAGSQ